MFNGLSANVSLGVRLISVNASFVDLSGRSHYSDTMLAGVGDTGTTGNSMNAGMNTVFIPQSTTRDLLQQQQPRAPGSPDVVSFREGLGTSDGPTL